MSSTHGVRVPNTRRVCAEHAGVCAQEAEGKRLKKLMDENDCVNIFVSEVRALCAPPACERQGSPWGQRKSSSGPLPPA